MPFVLIIFLPLYWETLSYHYPPDALIYASAVEAVRDARISGFALTTFLHSHHLLYNPLSLLVYLPCEPTMRAVIPMALLNGVLGVICLFLVVRIALRGGISPAAGVLTAITLGLSHAFWTYAVTPETYLLAMAGALGFMLVLPWGPRPSEPPPSRILFMALVWMFAVLGHVVNVLLVVPLAVFSGAIGHRAVALVAAIAGLGTLGLYVLAAGFCAGGFSVFAFLQYVSPPYFVGDYLDWNFSHGLWRCLQGIDAAIGPRFAGTSISPSLALLLVVSVGAAGVRCRASVDRRVSPVLTVSLASFVPFFVFFTVWDAGNVEFDLLLLPGLLLAMAAIVDAVRSSIVRRCLLTAWLLIAVAMGLNNYRQEIAPRMDIEQNVELATARWLKEVLRPQDFLIVTSIDDSGPYASYLPYFAGRKAYWIDHRARALGATRWQQELAGLERAAARDEIRIYCLGSFLKAETTNRLVELGVPADPLKSLQSRLRQVDARSLPPGGRVHLLWWESG